MEKDIAQGNIGTVGQYEMDLKGRKIVAQAKVGVPMGSAGMVFELDLIEVLKTAKAKIPGLFDDAVIDVAISVIEKLEA